MASKRLEVFDAVDKDEYAHVETPVEATEITPIQKEINEIMLLSEADFALEQKKLLRKVGRVPSQHFGLGKGELMQSPPPPRLTCDSFQPSSSYLC